MMGKEFSLEKFIDNFLARTDSLADNLADSLVDRISGKKTVVTKYGKREIVDTVTYAQLKAFLCEYCHTDHSAYGCQVICDFEDDKDRFKIAQLMIDVDGRLITRDSDQYVGRVFYVRRISNDILERMGQNTCGEFEIHNILTYNELFEFVKSCRLRYDSITQCSVTCMWNAETMEYKVVQIMLDRFGNAVKTNKGECIGRTVTVRALDEMIMLRLNNKQASEFMISLN